MSGQDRTCLLCGLVDRDVVRRLAWFDPPLPSGEVQAIDRCRDSQACRDRLEAAGETWPLDDRGKTQPSVRPATPAAGPDPAPRETPAAAVDELPAWEVASA